MKVKKLLKFLCFFIVTVPFAAGCQGTRETSLNGHHSQKYLLAGRLDASDNVFNYYAINNDTEYAISLKEAYTNNTDDIYVPDEYNDKPVTGIYRSAFYKSRSPRIYLPNTITVIDYEAFLGSRITTITIPSSVSQIGEGAFYSCKYLTKVAIQNSSTTSEASSACSCSEIIDNGGGERTYSTLKTIPSFCFFNCVAMKELVLPESIEEIEYEAFNGCVSLYSTLAFMNIKAIRSRAFQNCISLRSIYISSAFFDEDEHNEPAGIIEDHAFNGCDSSLLFHFSGDNDDITTWLNLSRNLNHWNQISEFLNPEASSNQFEYEITSGGASYSNDWIYTTEGTDVHITSYIGPTEIEGNPVEFLSFPNELPSGSGHYVRSFATDALLTVRANLKRIYLPKTLKKIDNNQFDSTYTNLIVIDDNTKCSDDQTLVDAQQNLTPRIILNGLTNLEVIGTKAFVNMPKLNTITKLYLPYSIKAVGTRAFGTSESNSGNKHLRKVTDFRWDYDDTNSALEVIGKEAFYKLGQDDNSTSLTGTKHQNHLNNNGTEKYQLTTLVIPRTFKHFGIFNNTEKTTYGLNGDADGNSIDTAFGACPLLSKVVFKGSLKSVVQSATTSTVDGSIGHLVIGQQTFTMNESLRTIVVEERVGRGVVLFTGNAYKPAIGWSSGYATNDFSGDPTVQTIVLPDKYTNLVIQNHALRGNSRAAIYLSGNDSGNKIKGSVGTNASSLFSNPTSGSFVITDDRVKDWHTIGEEDANGYYFDTSKKNSFGLSQKIPVYTNVLYKDTITAPGVSTEVEVGTGNTREYVTQNNCSFVTGITSGKATMTNYLYDRYSSSFSGTAVVPGTVSNSGGSNFTVDKIGDSAFSADYCDSTSYASVAGHADLSAVTLPDSIESIGDYAFMRAYGITKVSSATGGDYTMPSSLTYIGRHAFAFCHVQKVLNIPLTCKFYENENATTNETSVFSNNFSLRQITFGNGATSSTYYTTTTYTSSGGATYTSALYSKDNVTYNASSLLLVLNRDAADDHTVSDDLADVVENNVHYGKFNGQYADHFLYGAFKMCYWLKRLTVGITPDSSAALEQPLISGIIDPNWIYIGQQISDFTGYSCNLTTISFGNCELSRIPSYAFEGCEKLTTVELPRRVGETIPEGLFSYVTNNNMRFVVPADENETTTKTCAAGELDLTYTGYIGIDANAFKNSSITKLIAPITANFTIEEDAFANCTLTEVDLSNVTNKVELDACFRGATISTSSTLNFGSAAIYFNEEAFKGAKFSQHTFTFPANTAVIGKSCFEACNASGKELINVSAAVNLTNLERVVVDSENGKNNAGNTTGFKQIGDYAFYGCTGLNNFDFTNFTQVERIGHYAFSMNSKVTNGVIQFPDGSLPYNTTTKITSNGVINLWPALTNLGVGAFCTTAITSVTIASTHFKFERGLNYTNDSRAQFNKGGHQFRCCSSLTRVVFTEPNCVFDGFVYLTKAEKGQECFFRDDAKLDYILLPTGYDIQHFGSGTGDSERPDSMLWNSKSTCKVYTHYTTASLTGTKYVSEFWRKTGGSNTCAMVYYVVNNASLAYNDNGTWKLHLTSQQYWTYKNGEIFYLGTAEVDANTGVVTFKQSNTIIATADANGITFA